MVKRVDGVQIKVSGARKQFKDLAALDGLDLKLEQGEFVVLLGPSGSGKSTLIRCLAGIEKLDGGQIEFGTQLMNDAKSHIAPEKRDLAMVFQDYALWPHLTAFENVAYALRRRNLSKADVFAKTNEMLERVGLAHKLQNYPSEMSGGEQQRVALARAIVARPSLLLFDEPLSNLDADLRERLRVEISTLTREIGATALYITHDQAEAFALADRIGVINKGKIEQIDQPEVVYERPSSRFVASFTGTAGSLRGRVIEVKTNKCEVDLGQVVIKARFTTELSIGDLVDVLVRPAASSFSNEHENRISAEVIDIAYRGRGYEHVVKTEHGILTGVYDLIAHPRGSIMALSIDSGRCIAFKVEN